MGVRDEQALDEVVLAHRGRLPAAPAAALRAVVRHRLRLDVARVRERDHDVLRRDQILDGDVLGVEHDLASALVGVLRLDRRELLADDRGDPRRLGQDVEQVRDDLEQLLVVGEDLLLLEAGEPLELHLEDALRLGIGEPVPVSGQAEVRAEVLGLRRAFGRALEHLGHELRRPALPHQALLGIGRSACRLDERDDLVDVRKRDREAFLQVRLLARLAQVVGRPPGHHLAPVREEGGEHLPQVEQLRLAVEQRDHVDAEAVLQLGLLVEVVKDDLGNLAAFQLDHHAHPGLVRLVADVGDALHALLVHVLGDLLLQHPLVHLVRQLVDDDRLPLAAGDVLEVSARADDDAPATGAVALVHAGEPVDQPRGREIGRRHQLDQLLDRDVGLREQREARIDRLAEVVRGDVGRHPDRDSRGAVDEQVRQPRRQDGRLLLLAVVVRDEVDRLAIDVGEQLRGDAVEAALGVAHRRGVVAVDRPEVALAVDERVAHREVLRHPHQRVVDGGVAVRVVLAHHLADHAGALNVRPVPDGVRLLHREQDPAMHRLKAVAHVGERPADDHAHRVVEVRAPHLLFEAYRKRFLGELFHSGGACFSSDGRAQSSPCKAWNFSIQDLHGPRFASREIAGFENGCGSIRTLRWPTRPPPPTSSSTRAGSYRSSPTAWSSKITASSSAPDALPRYCPHRRPPAPTRRPSASRCASTS